MFDIIWDLRCYKAILKLHNFLYLKNYLRQKTCYETSHFIFGWYGCLQILDADLLQVATVMGLEDEIEVTDDIGTADAILASSSEMKQNPWIRGIAKFHQLPVFVIKVTLLLYLFCK